MLSRLSRAGAVFAVGSFFWLTGCQEPQHKMAEAQVEGKAINCKLCYDRVVTVRKISPKGSWLGGRKTVVKHMCPDCKVNAEIYTENGMLMIKCAGCAPDGHPCDKCLPPKSGS